MKKFTALALVAGLAATSAQAAYDLTYDATTGIVTVGLEGNMINIVLEQNAGATNFITANYIPFVGKLWVGGNPLATVSPATLAPTFIGESYSNQNLAAGGVPIAPRSIGQILPAGLTEAQWLAAVGKNHSYVANVGTPVTNFDLVYVPEPTSLALLGLGGLLVARRRRA